MTSAGWVVFAAVLALLTAFLVWRRARARDAIEELDGFALLTDARWEGDVLLCRIAGGTQLRIDVTTLTSIDWREYGDGVDGSDSVVAFALTFAGRIPPVAVMGSGRPSAGRSNAPIATVLNGLKQRGLIGTKPNHWYAAFSPVTTEARRRVAMVRRD
jgi:hypothetical protein